jgi:hypothetical protein
MFQPSTFRGRANFPSEEICAHHRSSLVAAYSAATPCPLVAPMPLKVLGWDIESIVKYVCKAYLSDSLMLAGLN